MQEGIQVAKKLHLYQDKFTLKHFYSLMKSRLCRTEQSQPQAAHPWTTHSLLTDHLNISI